jgi:hypothetical protein
MVKKLNQRRVKLWKGELQNNSQKNSRTLTFKDIFHVNPRVQRHEY